MDRPYKCKECGRHVQVLKDGTAALHMPRSYGRMRDDGMCVNSDLTVRPRSDEMQEVA